MSPSISPQSPMADTVISCVEVPPGTTAQLNPALTQKVVHLVRHGQGTHNRKFLYPSPKKPSRKSASLAPRPTSVLILSKSNHPSLFSYINSVFAATKHREGQLCNCALGKPGCPYLSEAHTDAKLTERGRFQATAAGARLLQTRPLPEIAFVSPLSRTLQTATIALSKASGLNINLVADENLRERNGVHYCDKRSPKEDVMGLYPSVDFTHIAPGPDQLWSMERETPKQLAERGKLFFLSLKDRPEKSFAVFTHSSFLYNTTSLAFQNPDPRVARRFTTGESRVVILTFT